MKRFRNYLSAVLYLRSSYKEPGESKSIYDGLRRSTLYGWFTTSGVLREKYQHCVQEETYFTKGDQHAPILSKYPEVEKEIISTLKKQRAAGQPLYGTTIQPLIKAILRKKVPHLLDFTRQVSMCQLTGQGVLSRELLTGVIEHQPQQLESYLRTGKIKAKEWHKGWHICQNCMTFFHHLW
jgi:hypothetical protein